MKLENSICMLIHGVKCYVLSLDHIIYWHLDVATIVQYLFFKSQLLQLVRQTKIINLVPLALLATTCQNSQEPIKSRSNFKAKCRFGSFLHVTAVASMRRTEALASVKFYQILSIFIFFIRLIILEDFIRLISYNGPCVHLGCSFFLATALHVGLHRIGGRSRPSYLFRKSFLCLMAMASLTLRLMVLFGNYIHWPNRQVPSLVPRSKNTSPLIFCLFRASAGHRSQHQPTQCKSISDQNNTIKSRVKEAIAI